MKNLVYFIVLVVFFLIGCENPAESNKPPTCIIKYPSSNVIIDNGDYITIQVEAEDEDGEIDEVRFYINDIGVSSDSEFPYNYDWYFEPGEFVVKAIAIDNEGERDVDSILAYVCLHTEYNGIPPDYYTDHFIDYFDDNKNGWVILNDDNLTTEIVNGAYKINNENDDGAYIFSIDALLGINNDDNYEIEVQLGVSDKNTNTDYICSFVWDFDSENMKYNEIVFHYKYSYGYINNFGIFNYDGSTYNSWFWQEYFIYYMKDVGTYNILTIRKYKDNYYFFLNGSYLCEHISNDFYGSECGFVVYENTCLYIDYLKIYKIRKPGEVLPKISYKNSSSYSVFNINLKNRM